MRGKFMILSEGSVERGDALTKQSPSFSYFEQPKNQKMGTKRLKVKIFGTRTLIYSSKLP